MVPRYRHQQALPQLLQNFASDSFGAPHAEQNIPLDPVAVMGCISCRELAGAEMILAGGAALFIALTIFTQLIIPMTETPIMTNIKTTIIMFNGMSAAQFALHAGVSLISCEHSTLAAMPIVIIIDPATMVPKHAMMNTKLAIPKPLATSGFFSQTLKPIIENIIPKPATPKPKVDASDIPTIDATSARPPRAMLAATIFVNNETITMQDPIQMQNMMMVPMKFFLTPLFSINNPLVSFFPD
jgi:hypothetical protein